MDRPPALASHRLQQDVALAATAALGFLGEAEINKVDRPRFGNAVFGTFASDFRTKDSRHFIV